MSGTKLVLLLRGATEANGYDDHATRMAGLARRYGDGNGRPGVYPVSVVLFGTWWYRDERRGTGVAIELGNPVVGDVISLLCTSRASPHHVDDEAEGQVSRRWWASQMRARYGEKAAVPVEPARAWERAAPVDSARERGWCEVLTRERRERERARAYDDDGRT